MLKTSIINLVVFFTTIMGFSQSASNDPTFNVGDSGFGNGDGFNIFGARASAVQSDGKIIIVGKFFSFNGAVNNRIVRLDSSGLQDNSFYSGTGFDADAICVSIQSDGKIIVGGDFTLYNGTPRRGLVRLNTDGSLDTSFNPGAGFDNSVSSIFIQSDGKIIIGGGFNNFNNSSAKRIVRLNSDGSLDTSFNSGIGFNNAVRFLVAQGDGKIIVGGGFTSYNGTARNRILRLNTDGSLDSTFDPGTGFDLDVNVISIRSDNKIIIGGAFSVFNGITINRIARLNTDGSLDVSFNPGGGFNAIVYSLCIQSDDKIVVAGSFTTFSGLTSRNSIARLHVDGNIDTSFDPGIGFNGPLHTVTLQSDGKIIAGGEFGALRGVGTGDIARLNSDCSTDYSFNPGTGFNTEGVRSAAIQSDGKIIVGGAFTKFNGNAINYIARLNIDGSYDASFNTGVGFNYHVSAIAVQSDNKIIIGGSFEYFNNISRRCIVRLNADGSLDTTFNIGTGFNGSVYSIAIQSDGKIIVGGEFTNYNGLSKNRIVRINADGSLDLSFSIGTGFTDIVRSINIQTDGKIIVGGSFTSFNGISKNRIARLNTDGSLDSSFIIGTGFGNSVYSTSIQSDGKIIAAGFFSTFNGVGRARIARLNMDGTLDNSFTVGVGFDSSPRSVCIQSDGKIIVGGAFVNFNNIESKSLVRLNTDGSFDSSFNVGNGFDRTVWSTIMQSDGKIIVAGDFNSYNSIGRNRILRLLGEGNLSLESNIIKESVLIYPNPTSGPIKIDLGNTHHGVMVKIFNSLGQQILSNYYNIANVIDLFINCEAGIYFIRLESTIGEKKTLQVVKK